jgi:hypothetical protein
MSGMTVGKGTQMNADGTQMNIPQGRGDIRGKDRRFANLMDLPYVHLRSICVHLRFPARVSEAASC